MPWTKVNRCLTEGRRALAARLAGIEAGDECTRLAPLLAVLAEGRARAEDVALLEPHVQSCLTRLKSLRAGEGHPA